MVGVCPGRLVDMDARLAEVRILGNRSTAQIRCRCSSMPGSTASMMKWLGIAYLSICGQRHGSLHTSWHPLTQKASSARVNRRLLPMVCDVLRYADFKYCQVVWCGPNILSCLYRPCTSTSPSLGSMLTLTMYLISMRSGLRLEARRQ